MEILMYHHICDDTVVPRSRYEINASVFRKQMQFLSSHGYYTPRLKDVRRTTERRSGKKPIVITFDDGYMDTYRNAFPVLKEFGLCAVFFVVTDFSRSTNWWDIGVQNSGQELLKPQHIKEMWQAGMDFGTHSFSHAQLPLIGDEQLRVELQGSMAALMAIAPGETAAIAYPYGSVDMRVKLATQKAGYACGFAAHSGPLRCFTDPFEIRRVFMSNRCSNSYLRFKFSGTDRLIRWTTGNIKRVFHLQAISSALGGG
jgi:peptidoglycan/xylan/chitin deacetylase (PgdA/CDA1 family)